MRTQKMDSLALTPEQCGVASWFAPLKTVRIVFKGLYGPTIVCKCVSTSKLDTFEKMQQLARQALIDAFRPEKVSNGSDDPIEITVKICGYGDRYKCYFTTELYTNVECVRVIHTPGNWDGLNDHEKTLKWACDFDECINDVIFKNKVQLPQ